MQTRRLVPPRDGLFGAVVALVFLVPATYATLHHEMWRDETQAWLIARDSPSLLDLFRNLDHESHPPLWHLLLYPLTRITHDPLAMRPLHLAIAAGSVWLFAARAPFARPYRVLFAAGYFPLYEYAAIARVYGLGMLLAFAVCAAWPSRRAHPLRVGFALFGLCMTSFVGWIVAGAFLVPLLRERRARPALGVALVGMAVAFYFLCPRPDGMDHVRGAAGPPLSDFSIVTDAMVAVPRPAFFYWNENILEHTEIGSALAPVLGMLLVAFIAVFTLRGAAPRVVYLLATFGLLAFFHLSLRGAIRHHGYLFIVFLMALWISRPPRTRLARATLGVVLAVQAVGAVVAIDQDRRYVFSSGARAAAWLHDHGLDDAPMVAEPDWAASTVLAYEGRREAWSPRTRRAGSFVEWNKERQREPSDEKTIAYARAVAAREGRDTVLLLNRPLPKEEAAAAGLVLRAELYDSVVPGENFYIYLVPPR